MKNNRFVISDSWGCTVSLEDLINDARFIFISEMTNSKRPWIVTKNKTDGIDCFEIDHDRYGLIVNSVTVFNDEWGKHIIDSAINITGFIEKWLIKNNASEFIIT